MHLRTFSLDEYHWLIAKGFFASDERCELLDGLIINKMSRDPTHDSCLAASRRILDFRAPAGWHVRVQSAVTTKNSEPEPDLAIVRGSEFDYVSRHPGAADAALLVEVANSSLSSDRHWKGLLYAQAGFPLYWIINLIDMRVEVYSDPSGPDPEPSYRRREDFQIGRSIPLSIGGTLVEFVSVAELLPPTTPSMPPLSPQI
jgi:Uma2 family endonuclease